ncbi:MAG: extracellular solute-binding protein [Elusimicrobia bacterium]|nr:extracellular solute-binding protein [Elusimicrobiota bacterium]
MTVWAMGEEGLRISIMARRFEKENPGVKVITQAIPWDAAHEKLLTSVVGGLPPDVCQLGTTWMAEFSTLKALEPLESYTANSKNIRKENFFEGSWNTCRVGEKLYGVPWYVDTRVLFYRKDLLADVGFSHPPRDWEEFKEVCQRLAKDSDGDGKVDRYGITLPVRSWGVFLPFVWQNGGDIFKTTAPEFREALLYYMSFFRENLTPSGRAADVDLFQAFKTGFYPMFISGPWMVELIQREIPEIQGKWSVSVLPAKKKFTSFVGGCNLVLFKDSKEKETGWKFIEFMSRPDIQIEWHKIMKSLPAVRAAWEDPLLQKHPMLKVFGEQMKDTQSPPNVPEWEQIADRLESRMEAMILSDRILDGNITATLESLEKDFQEILRKQETPKVGFQKFLFFSLAGSFGLLAFWIAWKNGFLRFRQSERRKQPRSEKAGSEMLNLKKSVPGYLFILPSVLILTIFLFIPILFSFLLSMTDWNIYGLADKTKVGFIGFRNYTTVLGDAIFWKSLWNTLIFTGAGVPFTIMISLLCATVLNEKMVRFKTFFRTAYFIPVVCTIVAVAVLWRWIYNPEYGLLNWVLRSLHLDGFNWLSDPRTALASLILMAAWKNFGSNMVIFLAGLQSIPETLYESARIDGANAWQLFLHVTLPGLRSIMTFVVIITTIGYLQFFAEPYVMTKGGPLNSTMSIMLYMYNQGFKFFELGYASALAYILFGIIFVFTIVQIRIRKSGFQVN